MSSIGSLTIQGFKSIQSMDRLPLNSLNVLIGANGVGKSNFISYFRLLSELVEGRLKLWTSKQGGPDRLLSYGLKETQSLKSYLRFGDHGYNIELTPTLQETFTFTVEKLFFYEANNNIYQLNLGAGHNESHLQNEQKEQKARQIASFCYNAIAAWKVFHFHDTSETAGVKRLSALHDNQYLRADASNLAAFLFKLKADSPRIYNQIRKTVRLAVPFFADFVLNPVTLESGEQQIRLLWQQRDSDYALWPSQLSDGSLRFICLVTALLQPDAPSTIIIDEPELGLHPYAITLLGALIRSASTRMQVIISTQSVPLLNEFELADVIVVEREKGASTFKRLDEKEFTSWLEDYSIGELWEKNILGGRPKR